MNSIRKATLNDLSRIAEIIVFNYRMNFYPIFLNDDFYFDEMTVTNLTKQYVSHINNMYVYDDGVIKGVVEIEDKEVKKLFVEPVLQRHSIGSRLLEYAINKYCVNHLWVLEKNDKAIRFYKKHSFHLTTNKKLEEGTDEYLVSMERGI